jgi:hypothetical protein
LCFTPSINISVEVEVGQMFWTPGRNYADFLVRNLFAVKLQKYILPLSCTADYPKSWQIWRIHICFFSRIFFGCHQFKIKQDSKLNFLMTLFCWYYPYTFFNKLSNKLSKLLTNIKNLKSLFFDEKKKFISHSF